MAAFETPWLHQISPSYNLSDMDSSDKKTGEGTPIYASFSPVHTGTGSDKGKTLLVHQKSPLLVSTPPQVTRALAFSHPYLLVLSHVMGLLSWTSGDPWESYLLVVSFWAIVLYGDAVIRLTGPVFMVGILIGTMYSRRYSPLSTQSVSDVSSKTDAESIKHQKSLDEIVDALNVFTSRCNILAEPWLQLTESLSTQLTPTTATTKPALGNLLLRVLMISPVWTALTFQSINIITTQRVVLVCGTIALTWHSRAARVCRGLLWRSLTIRRAAAFLTGLEFAAPEVALPALPPRPISQHETAMSVASKSKTSLGGVRFTFVVYENQRRWLGLGWTSAMLAYERTAWTDEHLNPALPKEKFQLPKVDGGRAVWKWVPNDDWKTEDTHGSTSRDKGRNEGWIYYDNKWNNGRRYDGWSQYTRRRKWYRDAELVEVDNQTPAELSGEVPTSPTLTSRARRDSNHTSSIGTDRSDASVNPRKSMFRKNSKTSTGSSLSKTILSDDDTSDRRDVAMNDGVQGRFGLMDDIEMSLG